MITSNNWKDYELIDSGDGEKLERWGGFTLARPDPLAIWPKGLESGDWKKTDAYYERSEQGGGQWQIKKELPKSWEVKYGELKFLIKPTSFKHTGLFPEQAVNWDSIMELIKKEKRDVNILNLFAYTGGATVAAAKAGAKVCHVDSSKGIVGWAKENIDLNGLGEAPVRFIVDDAIKFVEKEIRRGIKYDGIIMDPPSFGRGAKGEVWKIEKDLWPLVLKAVRLLSNNPLFFHVNSYTTGMSPTVIGNILESGLGKLEGKIEVNELGLKESKGNRILPQGVFGRWTKTS